MDLDVPFEVVDLVEGFNEMGTEVDAASQMKGVYDQEVEVAKKLDGLARDIFDLSLLEIFNQGDAGKVVTVIKTLADRFLIEEALEGVVCQDEIRNRLVDKIESGGFDDFEIYDKYVAERLLENELQILILKKAL